MGEDLSHLPLWRRWLIRWVDHWKAPFGMVTLLACGAMTAWSDDLWPMVAWVLGSLAAQFDAGWRRGIGDAGASSVRGDESGMDGSVGDQV